MRTKILAGVAVGGVLLLAGCLPRADTGCPTCPGEGPPTRLELDFDTVAQGTSSGVRDARQVLVRDGGTWAALWRQHAADVDPQPPLPEADFSREMIVAFFLGERPTAGYSVEIRRITLRPDRLVVRVAVTQPGSDDPVAQVLTQPFHMVKVQRAEVSAEFETLEP